MSQRGDGRDSISGDNIFCFFTLKLMGKNSFTLERKSPAQTKRSKAADWLNNEQEMGAKVLWTFITASES